jgi:hypothetical protein
LEHAKHHRGEVRTPDTAGAIIVLAANDRRPQRSFSTVIVHGDVWTRQEDGETGPVVVEALKNRALCLVEMALATIHLTADLHLL